MGYLFNMKQTRHYDEGGRTLTGMVLYFLQRDGMTFRCTFLYRPYFFVQVSSRDGIEQMKDILQQRFQREGVTAEIVDKEDLDLEDHIVGRKRKVIKLTFDNDNGLGRARKDLMFDMRRAKKPETFSFDDAAAKSETASVATVVDLFEHDVAYVNRVCIDNYINCGKWFEVTRNLLATSADNKWDTQCIVKAMDDYTKPPGLRIFAWDIECTKMPLKFPDSAYDRITMISIMIDGSGFLIVNRAEVSADIEPLEYTPKPEYEGIFDTFNEPDEAALLRRFFSLIRDTRPHIMVSFNGDFFDYPFVDNRAKAYSLDWVAENGIQKQEGSDFFAGQWIVHMDAFSWVQRDSYLPCGARGLKAVTRYKLKYDPVELDPEVMTPYAKERPQELAAYSVSDAVATYYLYMKYIHDFIFALCSIIPYGPDDVLRKGSGTLCESLLMNQAYHANVIFPNKHVDNPIEFHPQTQRLVEQSTYEGARVECMRVGVYRADIKETFQLEPSAFQVLIQQAKATCDFFITVEEKTKIEDIANYDEMLAEVEKQLRALCDPAKVQAQLGRQSASQSQSYEAQPDDYTLKLVEYEVVVGSGGVKTGGKKVKKSSYRVITEEFPLIYHLDVGAMYPNIILSNRLQPSAMVTKETCAACSYDDPSNNCKRHMDWKWRGELYMATRADVKSIINEMENEQRRYNQKDRDTGEIKRVKWSELKEADQTKEIIKAVRTFSQKAYSRLKSSTYEDRTDIVCQRENPFYVNTVLNFRDRRYVFKRATKEWSKKLEKAVESGDMERITEAKGMVTLNDSLQLAHKCILNSFYGYVMRKGARWHSMKMAGITTYTGSNLIREAREFCEMVGLPIELDTDGIWCMLPKSFPDTFKFMTKGGKELKMTYPNSVLNYRVHAKYTNHQYQDQNPKTGEWETRSENSIFFEVDGPYLCMVLPASTEEDKMLKKRYCVYEFDGSIAELKGFEMKRRGELKLIQVFQEEVFPVFLKGKTKEECYAEVGAMANRWLDVIESRGKTMTDDEVVYFFSEQKNMSKSVEDSGTYKSVQITTAKRLAEFLGVDTFIKDGGISCHLFIANRPVNTSTTERAVPVKIFSAEEEVKKKWLRIWLQDNSLQDFDMRNIIDWDYYKERLCAVFQKLISIPAAYQRLSNPCPRVKVPDWLARRVREQNDKFQQSSLSLYFKKATDSAGNALLGSEPSKRKMVDMEDMADGLSRQGGKSVAELPVVEFGKGPKKWLEAQRMRWAAGAAGSRASAGLGGGTTPWRGSLFDDGAAWSHITPESMREDWQIVAIERASAVRGPALTFRIGDKVSVRIDDDEDMTVDEQAQGQPGTIVGFAGSLLKVSLEFGGEQLLRSRDKVSPLKEEGLFVLWIATGSNHTLHRCEVLTQRQITLAFESDFSPDDARCDIKPKDLVLGMKVWPHSSDIRENRKGPGIVTDAAPDVGLCGVTWSNGSSEVVMSTELEQARDTVTRVMYDPPRNMQHACLIRLDLEESEFQQQLGEGSVGNRDASWPHVSAIYETELPLDFDLMCRLGTSVKVAEPEKVEKTRTKSIRFKPEDLVTKSHKNYLSGLTPARNVYLHLCFDRARPSRAFCGVFAPGLAEAWVCFSGMDKAEGEAVKYELEQFLAEQLSAAQAGADPSNSPLGAVIRAEVSFASKSSLGSLVQWLEQKLLDVRRLEGNTICIVCSQLSIGELRGWAPSNSVEQRHLRQLTALRDMPVCKAPFVESDSNFPALDWQRWITRRFASKIPQLFGWWRARLAICRAGDVPVCNLPSTPAAMAPAVLDTLFARQLRKDGQLLWASTLCRPDLGQSSQALVDTQEGSIDTMKEVLQGKDLEAGRGGGQVNNPGVYRSVCLEVNMKTKLCVCALQHARYLSDLEGGELSKKMIRKVDGMSKNMDHTSEVSITSFESLVNMVQDIAHSRDAKAAEVAAMRQRWAAQAGLARADILAHDDNDFIGAMEAAGHPDLSAVAKLEGLRKEQDAQTQLLDGLYSWLAAPTSLMYDAALLRKVHQYMDKVLQLFIMKLKDCDCSVIHASYSKILFATTKMRVIPDVTNFWESLCNNVRSQKVLQPLALDDVECLSELFYGVIWLDPANWAGIPIDPQSGSVIWRVRHSWKIADFLPPAVRPSLILYAGELLIGPQREIDSRICKGLLGNLDEMAADDTDVADAQPPADPACDEDVDVDDDGEPRPGMDVDAEGPACGEEAPPPAEAADADKTAGAEAMAKESAAPVLKGPELLEELREYIKGDFFSDLRRRILHYIDELQAQQQRELPDGMLGDTLHGDVPGDSDESGDEDGPAAANRKAERLRRHLEQKWSFPSLPGRRNPPGALDFEFMRALVQVLQLEDCLEDQIASLRERICNKLRVSSFKAGIAFENPCFPLILRDVACPWCCTSSHIDVCSHPISKPGNWICLHCKRAYDKDTVQARLVDLLETAVQAWQSQEINCRKCKSMRNTLLQSNCECFGRFQARFKVEDSRLVLRILRSLVGPHELQWLGEMLDLYEQLR
jgi:DNA polymerase epsilon subunit 1